MGSHEQLTLVVGMILGVVLALAAGVMYRQRRRAPREAGASPPLPAPRAVEPRPDAALERARAELAADRAEVDRRLARAQRSERAQNLLLSKLSHDLRSPLGTVVTLSQLLAEGGAGPISSEMRKYVEVIN